MKFAGILKQSLVDYPGKIAAVLFTRGCNFWCPFCHNGHLLLKPGKAGPDDASLEQVLAFLQERRGFLDAAVISGGEPCLNQNLPDVLAQIRDIGYMTKLDTNGSRTPILTQLITSFLIDYAAMDIKTVIDYEKYREACGGRLSSEDFFNVKGSINLLINAEVESEFRTTVIPTLHKPQDIIEIARYIKGAKKYSLQQFNPQNALDSRYRQVKPYSRRELQEIADECCRYVQEVRVLNA